MNLRYYREYVRKLRAVELPHREYVRVCNEIFAMAALSQPGTIIMVVGPTRVGKTKARKQLFERLVPRETTSLSDVISAICVEAAAADSGFFSMKHFTLRALEEIHHPIFGDLSKDLGKLSYIPRMKHTETALRLALERGLKVRRTRFLLIEEAHHMIRRKGKKRAGEILDSIKSLANTAELVVVMFGGYDLLTVGLSSAHINGRLKIVHFPRYLPTKEDLPEFDRVLKTLSGILPIRPDESLLNYRNDIYRGSLGCIGLVCEWCEAALALMAARGDEFMGPEHFSATRYERQLVEIKKDIEVGEKALVRMSMKKNPTEKKCHVDKSTQKRRKGQPFKRAATRDHVI